MVGDCQVLLDFMDDYPHNDNEDYHNLPTNPEEKLKNNRERNREHAKNTRLRKKAYVER